MMGNELIHLINDYLYPNPKVYNSGFYALSQFELDQMLHALCSSDHPDMYAKIQNKVYIIEHFEFDASKETRKGMSGIRKENELSKIINATEPDSALHLEAIKYPVSIHDYQKNFEHHFKEHYRKIDYYKKSLKSIGVYKDGDQFVISFWAECMYPPYYCYDNKFMGELYYSRTKQFAELLRSSPEISFMFFGGYSGGRLQLQYIDMDSLPPEDKQIDLLDPSVSFSNLNNNEVEMFCSWREAASSVRQNQ